MNIIRKTKDCLALSESANENESAVALKQAHALMQKHNIKESATKFKGLFIADVL